MGTEHHLDPADAERLQRAETWWVPMEPQPRLVAPQPQLIGDPPKPYWEWKPTPNHRGVVWTCDDPKLPLDYSPFAPGDVLVATYRTPVLADGPALEDCWDVRRTVREVKNPVRVEAVGWEDFMPSFGAYRSLNRRAAMKEAADFRDWYTVRHGSFEGWCWRNELEPKGA
jgi:hypothetical protein